jgi:predicted nucleic-acid-binding Zn-ribbon protein
MKTTGVCPKCGQSNIIRIEGQAKAYGAGNNIPVGMTIFTYVKVPRYLCLECGYSEEWIDLEDLPVLEEKFR